MLIKQRQSCLVTHEFKEDKYKSITFTSLVSVSYSYSFVSMGDWLQHPTHFRETKICGQSSYLSKMLQYLYITCSYPHIGYKSFLYYLWYLIQCTCCLNSLSTMWKVKALVTQSCPTLCNSTEWSLPGFSVHGILQARVLEWVAITFSREFSQPRDWTRVSCIAGRFFIIWAK